jgi:hypothetical protein
VSGFLGGGLRRRSVLATFRHRSASGVGTRRGASRHMISLGLMCLEIVVATSEAPLRTLSVVTCCAWEGVVVARATNGTQVRALPPQSSMGIGKERPARSGHSRPETRIMGDSRTASPRLVSGLGFPGP